MFSRSRKADRGPFAVRRYHRKGRGWEVDWEGQCGCSVPDTLPATFPWGHWLCHKEDTPLETSLSHPAGLGHAPCEGCWWSGLWVLGESPHPLVSEGLTVCRLCGQTGRSVPTRLHFWHLGLRSVPSGRFRQDQPQGNTPDTGSLLPSLGTTPPHGCSHRSCVGRPGRGLCRLEPGPQMSLWVSSLCCPESQLHVSLWAEPGGTSEPIPKLGVLGTSHSSYPTAPVPSSCSSESFLRDTCPAVLSAAYPLLASGLCEVAPVPLCSPLPPACLSCRRCDIRVPCLPATFAPQVQGPLLHPAWQTVGQTIVLQHTEPLGLISNPQRLLLPFLKVSRSHSF